MMSTKEQRKKGGKMLILKGKQEVKENGWGG